MVDRKNRDYGPSNIHFNLTCGQLLIFVALIFISCLRSDNSVLSSGVPLGAGEHSLLWDTKGMAAGCYAAKMKIGSSVIVKNILVSR
jgi:hypothetical protein